MKYWYIWLPTLALAIWIGCHLLTTFQEKSRIARLPREVSIQGTYSAKDGIAEAEKTAALWDEDCQLQCVFMAFGGDPHTDDPGMAREGVPIAPSGWNYRFFSATRGWFLDLAVWPDGRCDASSFNGIDYLDTRPLPNDFLDSTDAISIAEKLYGERYREDGQLFRLPTRLTTWPSNVVGPEDPVPHRATWQIHYLTTRHGNRVDLFLTIDAITGEELCAVESVDSKTRVLTNNYHR